MFEPPTAIFLVNLVQDVNVLRPLVAMAGRDFGFETLILVSAKFANRDLFGIWWSEIQALRDEYGARIEVFASDWEASRHLTGRGVMFAGSESSLAEHRTTHSIFRFAPATFLKVTLQHGFECVGFRQSGAHDAAHGQGVSFAADILCAWQSPDLLTALTPSQRGKVHVTGPSAVLQSFTDPFERNPRAPGIVCENLHSVRFRANSEFRDEFVRVFGQYCELLAESGSDVVLRPHPGGQYVLKNDVTLPTNARIENAPMYRTDLRRFAYGISAPSSVLVDMLLADLPTAVWRDRAGDVDADNYAGLTAVSTPSEWLDFAREASASPQPFIDRQQAFLAAQAMPIEPREVFARFAQIFTAAQRISVSAASRPVPRERILFVANAHLPTLQICLEQPLAALVNAGELATDLLTETRLREQERRLGSSAATITWLHRQLAAFDPTCIMFSRYSGPFGHEIIAWAHDHRVSVIYQIDDDLLGVPRSLGERKYAYHNDPQRLAAVRDLLEAADLVYASTERLRDRLLEYLPALRVTTGPINCSGRVIAAPGEQPATVMGYMASADHLPNLEMILPAVVETLDRHPHLSFELFGSIPTPPELARFGDRVRTTAPVPDYQDVLQALATRGWDIGLCPLAPTAFNLTKSNNKWVEYSALGIAVVASRDTVYDNCCAAGCGILASGLDEWRAALELLVGEAGERRAMVLRAQDKLESVYSIDRHRQQIMNVIAEARAFATDRAMVPDRNEDQE
jgi:hypothetical protein